MRKGIVPSSSAQEEAVLEKEWYRDQEEAVREKESPAEATLL